jgi:hypothetical protein
MKKQLGVSVKGRSLSRSEMKKIQGGGDPVSLIVWLCIITPYLDCYETLSQCQAGCAKPKACRFSAFCP